MNMRVHVGGSITESLLPELRRILKKDDVYLVDGDTPELDTDNQLLAFNLPNSIQFDFNLAPDMDGELHPELELEDFCAEHGLTIKKLLPPCVGSSGEHYNEGIWYRAPGMDDGVYIPTDGQEYPVARVEDVQDLFQILWDANTTIPETDYPLHINDPIYLRQRYAIERMAGKDFGQIFNEILIERVGHADPVCPPFTIVKGK